MEDFEQKKEEVIRAIKRPVPKEPELMSMRAIWLALICVKCCAETKKLFCKEFRLTPNEDEEDLLLLEMSILVISEALEVVKARFKREFSEKNDEGIEEIFRDCIELKIFLAIEEIFKNKPIDEIFDIYASYTFLRSEYEEDGGFSVAKKDGSKFIKNLHKEIRDFQRIDDDTKTKEQHFAKRIKRIFKDINEEMAVSFAKKFITTQGIFLAMDAFAGMEQEKINAAVKNFSDLLKSHNRGFRGHDKNAIRKR